jgi:hypothetical protein
MKQAIKRLLFGTCRRPLRIPFGLYKGLTLSIDPRGELGYFFGTYEMETHSWLRAAGKAARSFVDIGAGSGELVVWALSQPAMKRAMAYDSSPARWNLLRENLLLNGFQNDPRLNAECAEFLSPANAVKDSAAFQSLPEPILFKMDIDGGEEHVLRAMRNLLGAKQMFVLIETHSFDLDTACSLLLEEAGYRVQRIAQANYRCVLPERRPLAFNQWVTADNISPSR